MKKVYIIMFFLLLSSLLYSQRVGLVLSGGGAKGMAHLGVIQALEDNGIPIDYVTGTSIGSIVGALYAMGYSPAEMLELFKSDEFAYWQTGEIQEKYVYSYKRKEPTPDFFTVKFAIKDSFIVEPHIFPSSLINPVQMNIAFLALFSPATAASKGNFDNLFIPFRCVASDVYKKEPVVMKGGSLGDAVRASMSFPFVFKPIEINDALLFDGGIYDNFPVAPMKQDFNPDYLIGVSVSSNPTKPNIRDIYLQMENMIMQHTDYSIKEGEGTLIDFHFDNVRLLDFYKADELFKTGYDKAMEKMDEIKENIPQRVSKEELQQRRDAYKQTLPELKFKNIEVTGINSAQKKYILNSIRENDEFIYMDEFKENYFKLIADNRIAEVRPIAVYNPETDCFELILDVTLEDEFLFSVGGNVSSSVSSQAYFGLNYQALNARAWDHNLNAQFGKVYNSLQLSSQVDFPSLQLPFSIKLLGNIQMFNFYQGNEPFFENSLTSYFEQREMFLKLNVAFPISLKSTMETGIGVGQLKDYYYQPTHDFAKDKEDLSRYILGNLYSRFHINSLNDKQYPNEGKYLNIIGQIVVGNERYRSSKDALKNFDDYNLVWFQARGNYEQYLNFNKKFTLGILGDAAWSFRPLGGNYTASILQAPAFSPTPHSKYIFNEAFVANQFLAGGVKPIFNITRQLSLRCEFYTFVPIRPIERDETNGDAFYGDYFSRFEYMGEASLAFKLPFISMSIFGNYYSKPSRNWNVGFNIGYLIFNKKFLD